MQELAQVQAALDEKLVAYFDLFNEYQILHVELANHLKNGWWELGRARYAMGAGVNSLSQRQYPAFMSATARYSPEGSDSSGSDDQVTSTGEEDALHKRAKGKSTDQAMPTSEKAASKRKDKEDEGDSNESATKKDRERWKDPLHWFGLLPPASLRSAQKEFKSVVEVAFALTTTKRRLHAAQEEYEVLLERKGQLSVQ